MAKKKATKKKGGKSRPVYLREIEIRYKKRRVGSKSAVNQPLTDVEQVVELFKDLQNETKEKLIAISLDVKLKIIAFEVVCIGTVHLMSARPFELLRTPILVNAYGLILVHNHPSGDPEPSDEDKNLTKEIKNLCQSGGMVLHDHIIIGDGEYFSFAQEGLIERE